MNLVKTKKIIRRIALINVTCGILLLFIGSWAEINFILMSGVVLVTVTVLAMILLSIVKEFHETIDFIGNVFRKR
jgi:hypothetical protein